MATEKERLGILEDFFDSGKFNEVIKSSELFLEEFPSSFQIGFIRCKALLRSGKFDEAEAATDELLKIFPENINLLVEKGYLKLRNNNMSEARSFFEKALFLDPFNLKAKKGMDRVKNFESGGDNDEESPMSFLGYEKRKSGLEDTISESDLEKLMEMKEPDEPKIVTDGDSQPNVSISFEDSSMRKRDDIFQAAEEISQNIVETEKKSNIESALDELNKLSESDMEDLKIEEKSDEISSEKAPENDIEKSSFVTESAALLYLKQGLYDDAENIYITLYKNSQPEKFDEKIELINRVKLLRTKLIMLRHLMNKMKRVGENIV